jgi:hypothetical protein
MKKKVSASSVRNNYNIIALLINKLLNIDPAEIIKKDQQFVNDYFGISDK